MKSTNSKLFLLSVLFFIAFNVLSQNLNSSIKDKTQFLYIPQKLKWNDTLAILMPCVLSGEIKNIKLIDNIRDSLLYARITPNDYKRNTGYEYNLQMHCLSVYHKYFYYHVTHYVPMIQDSDYVLLNNEIKNTEKLVRDSTVKSLTMSDKMYNILSKYQGTIFLFTDIIEYYSSIRDLDPKSNCWIFFKILIFDKKNKKLLFYNTATVLNKAHFSHYRYQNFKRALHKFVRKNEDGQNSLYGNKLSIIRMVHPEFMQK